MQDDKSWFNRRSGRLAVRCLPLACSLLATGQLQAQSAALPHFSLFTLFSGSPSGTAPAPWRVAGLPGQSKSSAPTVPTTRFDITPIDNRQVLRMQTDASYGNLVHALPGIALTPGTQLRWSWRLDKPLPNADLRHKRGDDSPLKLCLLFDIPLARLSFIDRSVLTLARSVSGEKLPSATLCYVWDNLLPTGTVLNNAYTSRVRMIVLDSGDKRLGQWVNHQRDVAADFKQAFGSDSDSGKSSEGLPALDGVLVGADSDNAGGQSLAFVGDIMLGP